MGSGSLINCSCSTITIILKIMLAYVYRHTYQPSIILAIGMLTFSLGHLLMLMSRGMKYSIHRMENLYMTKYKHASIKIKFFGTTEY